MGFLKEKLGFDDAFNYKKEKDLKSALKRSEHQVYTKDYSWKLIEYELINIVDCIVCG